MVIVICVQRVELEKNESYSTNYHFNYADCEIINWKNVLFKILNYDTAVNISYSDNLRHILCQQCTLVNSMLGNQEMPIK